METTTYIKLKDKRKDNNPVWIVVHHGGGTDANPLLDTSNHTAKDMEAWHLSKGWEGLGYHYVIHKNGEVWKGRPEHYHGAHATDYNENSIGVCLSGNFDATLPTEAQIASLKVLLKDLQARYSIPLENIVPHRKFAKKTCYGKKLSDDWARKLVEIQPITTKEILLKRVTKMIEEGVELKKLIEEL